MTKYILEKKKKKTFHIAFHVATYFQMDRGEDYHMPQIME